MPAVSCDMPDRVLIPPSRAGREGASMRRVRNTRQWLLVMVAVAGMAAGLKGGAAALPQIPGVPTAEPETVGMSSERLERIDRVMQAYIDRQETAGTWADLASEPCKSPSKPLPSGCR